MPPIVSVWVKFFFLLTPFFVLSMFVTMTGTMTPGTRRWTAIKTTGGIIVICLFLYFFGEYFFSILGITLDAFRIGAGSILFINAVTLVTGKDAAAASTEGDISIVPMAIPYAVGPGTIGAILVMGAEGQNIMGRVTDCIGLILAIVAVGIMLYLSSWFEKIIGQQGMKIFSKLTGLILAALAAQIIFTGVKNLLG